MRSQFEDPSGFAHLRSRVRCPLAAANYLAQTLFFALVCTTSCYGCRTIRLAVMINARARKTVPWLASVRSRRPWYGNQLLCPALHFRCRPAYFLCLLVFSRHRRSDGQPGVAVSIACLWSSEGIRGTDRAASVTR